MSRASDAVASYSTNRPNNALNRFDVREVELDLRVVSAVQGQNGVGDRGAAASRCREEASDGEHSN